jgi:hypothetical protein
MRRRNVAAPDHDLRRDFILPPMGGARLSSKLTPIKPGWIYQNAQAVCEYAGTWEATNLRNSYLTALNSLQKYKFEFDRDGTRILLNFAYGDEQAQDTLRHIMTADTLPPGWQFTLKEQQEATERTVRALEIIRGVDPDLYSSLHTIMGTLVFAHRNGFDGGSVSDVIGLIWVGLSPSRSETDYAELITHEYVHHCLFLDDMVNGIFEASAPRMGEEDALVTSAILKTRRPYDKAFHSAFVSLMLIDFYTALEMPAKAHSFLDPLLVTARELCSKPQFLREHGNSLLDELSSLAESRTLSAAT